MGFVAPIIMGIGSMMGSGAAAGSLLSAIGTISTIGNIGYSIANAASGRGGWGNVLLSGLSALPFGSTASATQGFNGTNAIGSAVSNAGRMVDPITRGVTGGILSAVPQSTINLGRGMGALSGIGVPASGMSGGYSSPNYYSAPSGLQGIGNFTRTNTGQLVSQGAAGLLDRATQPSQPSYAMNARPQTIVQPQGIPASMVNQGGGTMYNKFASYRPTPPTTAGSLFNDITLRNAQQGNLYNQFANNGFQKTKFLLGAND